MGVNFFLMPESSLLFDVTLNTQFIRRLKLEHLRFGPVHFVTAHATEGHIFVPLIHNVVADRMCRVGQPFVTLAAEVKTQGGFVNEQNVI